MTTTPTQEPARAGEQMTENTKAVECRGAEIAQRLINAAGQFVVICREGPITDEMQEYLADVFQSILDDNAAQPAVPEGVDIVRKALELATVICDTVPARLHANGDEGWQYRLGVLVNKQPDGTHGYRLIQDALAALSAPQPAAQESAQPAGEQERRENSKHWPLLDRVEFALRDASFDLDEAFAIAHHVSLTYPPQPESAQGERGAVDRAQFEGWARKALAPGTGFRFDNDASAYTNPYVQTAWAAWTAALTTPTGDQNARAVEDRESLYLHGGCTDSYCRLCAMDRWERKPGMGHAGISPYDKKRTPTGDQNARAVESWKRLETWLGTYADSIPGRAYHELCAIQIDLIATSAPQVGDGVAKNAARYMWLRNPANNVAEVIDKVTGETPMSEDGRTGGYLHYEYRAGDELDAAIDAAIARTREGGEGECNG